MNHRAGSGSPLLRCLQTAHPNLQLGHATANRLPDVSRQAARAKYPSDLSSKMKDRSVGAETRRRHWPQVQPRAVRLRANQSFNSSHGVAVGAGTADAVEGAAGLLLELLDVAGSGAACSDSAQLLGQPQTVNPTIRVQKLSKRAKTTPQ